MSTLEVNKVKPQTGTDVQLGESGDTITVPSGATLDASNATTSLPATVVTTTGTQTLTNKSIASSQITGTITPSDDTVTGAKLNDDVISSQPELATEPADTDEFLVSDAGTIKRIDYSLIKAAAVSNQSAFRNIIINGDMSQAQRSTSETSQTSSGYICVDRFNHGINSQGTWTISQDTTVPTGQGFANSMKMDCTTADASPAADDYIWFEQKIEGQNLQYLKKGTSSAESITVSFWVNATKTGTNIVEFYDKDNTRHICQSYTINSSNTWEKKTITFAGDTSGAFNNDNGESASLLFWIGAGSNFQSGTLATSWASVSGAAGNRAVGQVNHADSTSNNFYLTGIQMEAGTSASDFEFLPVDVNLQRCQRYFISHEKFMAGTGDRWSTNMFWCGFKVASNSLRAVPTVTKDDGSTSDIVVVMNGGNRDSNADLNQVYSASSEHNWKSGYITLVFDTSFNPDNTRGTSVAFNRNLHIDSEL